LLYWVINRIDPPKGLDEMDGIDYFGTFTAEEAEKMGLREATDSGGVEVSDSGKEMDSTTKKLD
jgi:NCS1 family nucleobase:cation symporter-1